jgi:hypothetical protein
MRILTRKLAMGVLAWFAVLGFCDAVLAQPTPAGDQAAAERVRLREDLDRLEAQLAAVKERLRALENASASPSPSPAPLTAAVSAPSAAPPTLAQPVTLKQPIPLTQPTEEDTAQEFQSRTGPISGYMDFHFNKRRGEDGVLDFHRFVLLVNHSVSDRLRFVGELELEHALVEGLEEAGELELEAYLDFLLTRIRSSTASRSCFFPISCCTTSAPATGSIRPRRRAPRSGRPRCGGSVFAVHCCTTAARRRSSRPSSGTAGKPNA